MLQKCMKALLITLALIFNALTVQPAFASDPLDSLFQDEPKFLPVDDAFIFDAKQNGSTVRLDWTIADDYYLYADKFQFAIENAEMGQVTQPEATQIEDEFFGIVDVYFFQAVLEVEVKNVQPGAMLKVRYQGCASAGLCYNPVTKQVPLVLASQSDSAAIAGALTGANDSEMPRQTSVKTEQNMLLDALSNDSLFFTLLVFFGLGVGLAFTPCVFPMFPILSSIIAGQKNLSVKKGLFLSFVYVQGMALTYSLLGLVVATMGLQFQAALQHPYVLIAVSVIFVLLAAAMFGWINLQMPQSWTAKLTATSNNQKAGNIGGVFVMGALSGLIASPCTTAPLTGALLYVAQSGDMVIGFVTLYVLSLGMGLPLLLIGASGGSLLPKAGNWMNVVKNVFGFVMLAIPLILLERIIDLSWVLLLAGLLLLAFAAYLHSQYIAAQQPGTKSGFWLFAQVSLIAGALLLVKPWWPTTVASGSEHTVAHGELFTQVVDLAEIDQAVQQGAASGQYVMVDLYADWCVACKEFEALTFSDQKVLAQMEKMTLLQVDMTENADKDIDIMERYNVLGLPTILFFDRQGNEITEARVTGFMNAEDFLSHLQNIMR